MAENDPGGKRQQAGGCGTVFPEPEVSLDHRDVAISNNLAEIATRPFVVDRTNWLFCDSIKGAESSAIVYSLVETVKANGVQFRLRHPLFFVAIFQILGYTGRKSKEDERW